jgi:hypothetical protein
LVSSILGPALGHPSPIRVARAASGVDGVPADRRHGLTGGLGPRADVRTEDFVDLSPLTNVVYFSLLLGAVKVIGKPFNSF